MRQSWDVSTAEPSLHRIERGRDQTRLRLLDAANRRFRAYGYEATSAASIAADAGMTERTFFRHFPTKADVLVANWEHLGEALRVVLATSSERDVAVVVRDALAAFVEGIAAELAAGLDSVVRLYTDRSAFLAIMEHLLGVEHELAVAIAARTARDQDDFEVRVAANASMGVMRAAIRAAVLNAEGPGMVEHLDQGMERLAVAFADLDVPS